MCGSCTYDMMQPLVSLQYGHLFPSPMASELLATFLFGLDDYENGGNHVCVYLWDAMEKAIRTIVE